MPLHGPILQLLLFINPPDKTQHRGEKNLFTHKVSVKVAQSCPILCDPVDGSPPGSSVHGISQARILEWVAIPFSMGSSQPQDGTQVPCIGRWIPDHLSHQESSL